MTTAPRSTAALVALVTALALAGCGGGRIGKQGDLRLVNANTDTATLDLYAGDARIVSAVAAESAGGYGSVDAGKQALAVRLADGGAQLASTSADVVKDTHTTVLAYSAAGVPAVALLGDDEAAPSSGNAKVRVFNAASADAGALDAYLSPTGCTSLGTSNAVATNATSSAASAYVNVGAGAAGTPYHLCVTAAGDSSDLRLELPALVLTSRQVTTVVLTATSGGVLVNGLVVDQQGAAAAQRNRTARLRVVADAANNAPVSVTANGVTLAAGSASPAVGLYTAVAAGALAADVRIGGAAVATGSLSAPAGADLTLLVAGSAAAPTVNMIADDNRLSTAQSAPTRLRLVHGLNGAAGTLSLTADLVPVASGVAFGTGSKPVNVAGLASALIQVTTPTSVDTVYSVTAPSNLRSGVYTVFVLGDSSDKNKIVGVLRPDRLSGVAPAASAAAR